MKRVIHIAKHEGYRGHLIFWGVAIVVVMIATIESMVSNELPSEDSIIRAKGVLSEVKKYKSHVVIDLTDGRKVYVDYLGKLSGISRDRFKKIPAGTELTFELFQLKRYSGSSRFTAISIKKEDRVLYPRSHYFESDKTNYRIGIAFLITGPLLLSICVIMPLCGYVFKVFGIKLALTMR